MRADRLRWHLAGRIGQLWSDKHSGLRGTDHFTAGRAWLLFGLLLCLLALAGGSVFLWRQEGTLHPGAALNAQAILVSFAPTLIVNVVTVATLLVWHLRYFRAASRAVRYEIYTTWIRAGRILHLYISPTAYAAGAAIAASSRCELTKPMVGTYILMLLLEAYRTRKKDGPLDVARRLAAVEGRRRRDLSR
jgi:hypothetical protein